MVDAVVAATAADRTRTTVATSDPDDLQALLASMVAVPVVAVWSCTSLGEQLWELVGADDPDDDPGGTVDIDEVVYGSRR